MKILAAFTLALALAGCAQMRTTVDWLASDKTQKAAANLKAAAAAIDCGLVVPGAALSEQIARLVETGEAAVDRTGKVRAVSAAICEALGGASSAR